MLTKWNRAGREQPVVAAGAGMAPWRNTLWAV